MARYTQRTSYELKQQKERINTSVRKGTKRRLQLWLVFMCVFIGWGGYTYVSQMFKMQDLEKEMSVKSEEFNQTQLQHDELQAEIDKLNTTEYILQIARSRGMRLPDELFIRTEE